MSILAFDTSTLSGSVCLQHNGELLVRDIAKPQSQAGALIPVIESVLNEAGIWYDDLKGLATTIGPGSFTGLRIGLATARSIAFMHPTLNIHPFSTLECLAAGYAGDASEFFATLRAGKGEIYLQQFKKQAGMLEALDEITIVHPDTLSTELTSNALLGNTQELTGRSDHADPTLPHACDLLRAIDRIHIPAGRTLKPLYIRPPDAKLPTG